MAQLPTTLSNEVKGKYRVSSNTLIQTVKDQNADRLEVEVGDLLTPGSFIPQLKIKRWDNEVNFSLRFNLPGNFKETVTTEGEKIIWEKNGYRAVFYDKPEASEEGGYEFEIHIPRKPPTSQITFSINTKELDYFFQPALTPEEIAEGASRPENVVGSYAVYHKTKANNLVGGKEYKVGKAFHIFRPHLTDSVGNSTYADLLVDEVAGTLTITAPQSFLDTAVYPIIVDPTFGYTTVGGTFNAWMTNTRLQGTIGTPASSGNVDSISVYCEIDGGNLKGVMVAASNLNILTDGVSNAVAVAPSVTQWTTASYTNKPSVVASTSYVVMFIQSWGSSSSSVWYDTVTNSAYYDTSNSYTTPTNPTDATLVSRKYSAYATYTASSSSAIKAVSGVAVASISKVAGVAKASISKIAGLA